MIEALVILYLLGAYLMFIVLAYTDADVGLRIVLIIVWPLIAAAFVIGAVWSFVKDVWNGD